jgi:hypothetical protein
MHTKQCNTCLEYKDIEEFYLRKDTMYRRIKCKYCHGKKQAEYRAKHVETIATKNKAWRENKLLTDPNYREKERVIARRTKAKNRDRIREREKTEKYRLAKNTYLANKFATDSQFKIRRILRNRFKTAVLREYKNGSCLTLLGCTIAEFKQHIESKFIDGMSWENYGDWHMDHIRPCCSFDLTNLAQQALCFHYTNMQPLWAKDNLIKGGMIIQDHKE